MATPTKYRVHLSGELLWLGPDETKETLNKREFKTLKSRLKADLDGVEDVELESNGVSLKLALVVDGPTFTEGFGPWLDQLEEVKAAWPDLPDADLGSEAVAATLEDGGAEGLYNALVDALEGLNFDFASSTSYSVTAVTA
ncbi:MAG: hypothetical protein Q4C89_13810 [Deinococcus sp.]|uniref:hypothetical protein n=1 Tax=Deinococcus sp. TaxID=47478 RepID=UPI0026DCDF55|nr:hypothetical protein [Deinococcus sp.]MDO4247090.1 hypothetical protein [Deinococcus sp.]